MMLALLRIATQWTVRSPDSMVAIRKEKKKGLCAGQEESLQEKPVCYHTEACSDKETTLVSGKLPQTLPVS